MFLKAFTKRLITVYKQEWSDSIANNDRYVMYITLKSRLSMSSLSHGIKHIETRKRLLRLRLGVL